MSLRFILLGLLMENSGHGYGLKKQILHRLGHFRNINEGQLYTELAKMEKEGLTNREVVIPDKGPARKLMHITKKGKKAFLDWLDSEIYEDEGVLYDFMQGYPFFAKCNFFWNLKPEQACKKIEKQLSFTERKRKTYEEILSGMKNRNVDPYRIRILTYGLEEMEHRIRWLNECKQDLLNPKKEAAKG